MPEIPQYVLVDIKALPEVFEKVIHAKLLLAKGIAKSSTDACRMADVSRGAFYKYRDSVFVQDIQRQGEPQTLYFRLSDEPGVLSAVLSQLYESGANILTVNQSVPVDLVAVVTVSFRLDQTKERFEVLTEKLSAISGVIDVKLVS